MPCSNAMFHPTALKRCANASAPIAIIYLYFYTIRASRPPTMPAKMLCDLRSFIAKSPMAFDLPGARMLMQLCLPSLTPPNSKKS